MLKEGVYISENNESWLDRYRIKMKVKETEKSYIFRMVEYENRYGYDHIKTLFNGKDKVVIQKNKGGHAMRVWTDKDFTIYPFQAGIPFHFKLIESEA